MRSILITSLSASLFCLSVGCVVHERYRPVERERVIVDGPVVVDGPGVEVVEVEPDPVQRVYIYDRGYPPGAYYYNNYYYYGGRRYEHDVFVTRVVNENITRNRYVNVTENQRAARSAEQQQRADYARTGGRTNVDMNAERRIVHPNEQRVNQHRPQAQQPPQEQFPQRETHRNPKDRRENEQ